MSDDSGTLKGPFFTLIKRGEYHEDYKVSEQGAKTIFKISDPEKTNKLYTVVVGAPLWVKVREGDEGSDIARDGVSPWTYTPAANPVVRSGKARFKLYTSGKSTLVYLDGDDKETVTETISLKLGDDGKDASLEFIDAPKEPHSDELYVNAKYKILLQNMQSAGTLSATFLVREGKPLRHIIESNGLAPNPNNKLIITWDIPDQLAADSLLITRRDKESEPFGLDKSLKSLPDISDILGFEVRNKDGKTIIAETLYPLDEKKLREHLKEILVSKNKIMRIYSGYKQQIKQEVADTTSHSVTGAYRDFYCRSGFTTKYDGVGVDLHLRRYNTDYRRTFIEWNIQVIRDHNPPVADTTQVDFRFECTQASSANVEYWRMRGVRPSTNTCAACRNNVGAEVRYVSDNVATSVVAADRTVTLGSGSAADACVNMDWHLANPSGNPQYWYAIALKFENDNTTNDDAQVKIKATEQASTPDPKLVVTFTT